MVCIPLYITETMAVGSGGMEIATLVRSPSDGRETRCAAYMPEAMKFRTCAMAADPLLRRVVLEDGTHTMIPICLLYTSPSPRD